MTNDSSTPAASGSEVTTRAQFSHIRYAQLWEDARVLRDGLAIQPGERCLSIASAGDNALSLLADDPAEVVAVDLSATQLHCLALRIAALRTLSRDELLQLLGSHPAKADQRQQYYQRCRPCLDANARIFWDAHPQHIANGIAACGKFERYFALFRRRLLPLVHNRKRIERLLCGGDRTIRLSFFENQWNTWRWRLLFNLFFSRRVMGWLGRDPAFFRYVEGSVADRILERTRHALVELDPCENPYLQWILTGSHETALPDWLLENNWQKIRSRVDRLVLYHGSIEDYLEANPGKRFDAFNLSDIFEYMSDQNYEKLLRRLLSAAMPGAHLAYWNMLVPRQRPQSLSAHLEPLRTRANQLHAQDRAFFYSAFVLERVTHAP